MSNEFQRFEPTEAIDIGPAPSTLDTYNAYKRIFDNIEKQTQPIAQSLVDQQAQIQGSKAGKQLGFKTGLAIGEAARAYNQAGLTANRMYISNKALETIDNYKNEALGIGPDGHPIQGHDGISHQSIQEFNKKLAAYTSSSLETIPEENRQYYTSLMASKSTIASGQLSKELSGKNDREATLDFYNSNDHINNQVSEAVNNGNIKLAASLMQNRIDQNTNLALSGVAKVSSVKSANDSLKKNYLIQTKLFGFQQKLKSNDIEGATKYLSDIKLDKDVINTLGIHGASSLHNYMKSLMSENSQGQQITALRSNSDYDTILDAARSGKSIPLNLWNERQTYNVISGKSANNKLEWNRIQIAQNARSYYDSAINDKPQGIVDTMSDIDRHIDKISDDSPNGSFEKREFISQKQQLQKVLDAYNPNSNKYDPVSIINKSKGYKDIQDKIAADPDHFGEKDRLDYLAHRQADAGINHSDYKFMTTEQANSEATAFKNADDDAKIFMMNQIASQYGQYKGQVFRQLSSISGMPNLNGVYSADSSPETQANAVAYMHSMLVPAKFFEGMDDTQAMASRRISENSDFITYANALHEQGIYTDTIGNYIHESARFSRYLQQAQHLKPDEADDIAVKTTLSAHVDTQNLYGNQYVVQKMDSQNRTVDTDNVKAALHYLSTKVVKGDGVVIPEDMDKDAYITKMRAQIRVKNDKSDGFTLTDNLQNNVKFKNRDDKITYDEIQNLDSPLMKQVVNEVIKKYGIFTPENVRKYSNESIPEIKRVNTSDRFERIVSLLTLGV